MLVYKKKYIFSYYLKENVANNYKLSIKNYLKT